MITILDRYIGRTIATNIVLALMVFVALDIFFSFVRELDEIGRGEYTLGETLIYLGLKTPYRVYEFFPIAALLGAIIGLGMLASGSELTVMRAAGVSVARITGSVMKTGAVMMLFVILIGEFVVPPTEEMAETRRSLKKADQSALKTEYGFWSRDGGSFINIRDIKLGGRIGDVYLYEFDNDYRLRRATYAGKARYENDEWLLEDIVQSEISDKGVKQDFIKRARWNSLLAPGLLNIIVLDPMLMPAYELVSYVTYLRSTGQAAERYSLAMWNKITLPISVAVMLLLAVPFVFGTLRSVGIGQRILVGFLVGFGFHILNQAFGHLGLVYTLPSVLSATLPTLLFFIAALWMMRRI